MISGLVRAAHAGPALAVVVLATLLAVATGLDPARVVLVAAAVLPGQLSVGWSNDLLDQTRDRRVGRTDKPLAAGDVGRRVVVVACGGSVAAVVVLSLACGTTAGLVHLACVASAWTYNIGLKSTPWSWAPYAVSFGGLVVFVSLAGSPSVLPPWWQPVAGALLGVGAHLLNVLPDLADDAATGVHGLPHRLGPRLIPLVAVVVLVAATITLSAGIGSRATFAALPVVALLSVVVLVGRGRVPFLAAILISLTDVVLLLTAA